jgi:malate permease and related proteins
VAAAIVAGSATGIGTERQLGARAERGAERLLSAIVYVALPPVVFLNVAHLHFNADLAGGVVLGWVAVAIVGALAWMLTRGHSSRPVTGTVMTGSMLGNTAYLGYPLTTVLLGSGSLPQAVLYDLTVAVPALFIGGFGIGATFGTGGGDTAAERARAFLLRNPLIPAFLLGLAAPAALAPQGLVSASRVLVFCLLPAGFFAVGVYLESTLNRLGLPPPSREVVLAVGLRLAVAPLVLWLLTLPLIDLPGPFLLLAAMPCAINVLLVANVYGLDRTLAAAMIAWSTALVLAAVLMLTIARI